MINQIWIENLKCFSKLQIDLGKLTLLTGFNAGGKSTVLQSLLLLSQSILMNRTSNSLALNGEQVALGSPSEVLNNREGAKTLSLGISNSEASFLWKFFLEEEFRRSLSLASVEFEKEIVTPYSKAIGLEQPALSGITPVYMTAASANLYQELEHLIFLSAGRLNQTNIFPSPDDAFQSSINLGTIGQFASFWLYQRGDSAIADGLSNPSESRAVTLRLQLNSWMSELFPGTEVNAVPIEKTNQMRLEFRTSPTGEWNSPANVGYGISYAFPILMAGLLAGKRQPVIIDSPEAHLHPMGQSRMGHFLANAAQHGNQMIVETHSDHLLNGVRLAVRDGRINPDDVAIYFFAPKAESHVTRLALDKSGRISDWPAGFFDQAEKDLATLAGWN